MTMRMHANGTTGVVAVYDYTAGDDAPLTAPLSNIARLRFHSSLIYPAIVSTWTGTVNLPAVSANTDHAITVHTLFAHGRGGVPMVKGKITSGLGQTVSLCGSVPVQQSGTGATVQFPRVVHLGADATNVYLNDYGTTWLSAGFSALSLGLTVYVLDVLVA